MGDGQRYVSAWESGLRNIGGEWIKEGSRGKGETLNSLMQVDHVIRVGADGLVYNDVRNTYAPEINMETDDDGQIMPEHDAALIASLKGQGWTAETGWTSQYGAHKGDPIMHESEFVGGDLAEHIIGSPGLWVVCAVEVDSEVCPNGSDACVLSDMCVTCADGNGEERERVCVGWVIMHRPVPAVLGTEETGTEINRRWPVLREGEPTGTHIGLTRSGYVFHAPPIVTGEDLVHYTGEPRVTIDDARKDAEEWLTENVA